MSISRTHQALSAMMISFILISISTAEGSAPDATLLPLLQQMVAANPEQSDTWRLIGRIQQSQGEYQQALDSFQQSLEIQPDNAAAHHDLGQMYLENGDKQNASTHFDLVLEYAPESRYAQQLIAGKLVSPSSKMGVVDAGYQYSDEQVAFEEAGYEIQTFDGADDLDRRLNELDLESPEVVKDFRVFLEFGSLYNTNVTLTPISRELQNSDSESVQGFLNPDVQWIFLRRGLWKAGSLARGAFTVNEKSFRNLDLASFQPGFFVERDLPNWGESQILGRIDYVYSMNLLGGSRFGARHTVTASSTIISPQADVTYAYISGSLSNYSNDGIDPAVTSLDGPALTAGISRFLQTDLKFMPTWSLGTDIEFADTKGSDYRYNGINLYGNVTFQLHEKLKFIPSAGVGYRDYYDFTGPVNRDELTWRMYGRLQWQCSEHWSVSAVAGYDRFASDNEAFDAERIEGGIVFTYIY